MKNSSNFVVDVKGITKSFDKKVVVNSFDLKVKKGGGLWISWVQWESGKTTLLRMLRGL